MADSIQSLSQEGELDSQGQFTLDPQLALRKLNERLLQPEDCLLYLLQSAVASGASWVKVESGLGEIVLGHDGFFPTPEQAPEILSWAFESATNPQQVARQRLGMALASCLTLPGRGLRLEYPDGRAFLWLPGKRAQCSSFPLRSAPQGRRIRLPIAQSWWRRFLGTARCATLNRLRQRGRFAPIAVTVDGLAIAGVEFGKEAYANSWAIWSDDTTKMGGIEDTPIYYSDHHAIEVRVPCPAQAEERLGVPARSKASRLFPAEGGECCSAALGWRLNRRPGLVELVQYGVSLGLVLEPKADQLWMLLADHSLPTDLTCLKPVLGEPFFQRVSELRQAFNKVFETLREEHAVALSQDRLEVWLVTSKGKWADRHS